MVWSFHITATNNSGRDLICEKNIGHKKNWGIWCRDNVDQRAPLEILKADGVATRILGIRAQAGTWTGYECSAQWIDPNPGTDEDPNVGSFTISLDVPYFGSKNHNAIVKNGLLMIDGWDAEKLNKRGDVKFFASLGLNTPLTISGAPEGVTFEQELVYEEDTPEDVELMKEYEDFQNKLMLENPKPDKWDEVKTLKVVEEFDVMSEIPSRLTLTKRLISRSTENQIPRELWEAIVDKKFPDTQSKRIGVKEYFYVNIYSIGTDPRCWKSLVKKSTEKVTCTIKVESQLRQTTTINETIEVAISGSVTEKSQDVSKELKASMNNKFTYNKVTDKLITEVNQTITEKTFTAPDDKDVTYAPWVFGAGILLFRRNVKDAVELIAMSDWLQASPIWKTYDGLPNQLGN